MKHVLVLLILVFATSSAWGQCAIYVSDNGPWGAEYIGDTDPKASMDEVKKLALQRCNGNGGTNCHLLYSSYESGWYGLLRGYRADGRILYEVVYGQSSESNARQNLLKLFARDNGVRPDTDRMKIWHVK